ncbi:MAG: hypothetical protein D6705_02365 [Deltaproteobacteria bacterium]|nr:MAG: hypothetical protein D6705_02365 [Deltaproteobacteria bacterium]
MNGRSAAYLVGLAAFAAAGTVWAGNGTHPRTPVLWDKPGELDPPACLTVVDRSTDPVLHLPYAIPYEDTEVTPDEVDDSRTHQFLAFCRAFDAQHEPPLWLSEADVAKAGAKGLVPPEPLGPEDVLDTNTELAGCYTRITGDDERRPITFEMAAMGVDWDTTGLEAGPWTVYGYTWEPVANLWSLRPGVVLVSDGPDAPPPPPAMALEMAPGEEPYWPVGAEARFSACVAAEAGATVQLYWAEAADAPAWQPWGEAVAAPSEGTVELAAEVPAEMAGKSVLVRATITDPQDRSYDAYLRDVAIVFDAGGDTGTTGGIGTTGGPSETTSGSGTGGSSSDTGTGTGLDTGGAGGCGCTTRSPVAPVGGWLLVPVVAILRRRRPS